MAFEAQQPYRGTKKFIVTMLFCIIGIAINLIGSQLTSAFQLPLFLDSIGTMLAAIIGGTIPGIIVGYLTNITNMVFDEVSIYYGAVSVLIAVCASFFARRGWFNSFPKTVAAIIIFALIGGGLSSVITSWLFGFGFSGGMSTPLAEWIFTHGLYNEFCAQFTADFIFDLADKTISLLVALLVVKLLPDSARRFFDCSIWLQTPLTQSEIDKVNRTTKPRVLSIRAKIALTISVVVVVVGFVTVSISYMMFNDSMVQEQERTADSIADLTVEKIDADRINEFLENGESAPDYADEEKLIAEIRDSFPNVEYIYVYQIREDGCHVVLDPDTAEEQGSDPGTIIPFDKAFEDQIDNLLTGQKIDPIISNESYGWLLTVYHPIKDSSGKCVAYAGVDLRMDHIVADGTVFLGKIFALFLAFFILICAVALWLARYSIVMPINAIALATSGFAYDNEGTRADTIKKIRGLKIRTGDEIENLYGAVTKTAEDTAQYIADASKQAETIERMQESLIMVMADLVESRDKFTGDHVRKTAAYCKIITAQMRKEGIYSEELTDEFISDVVHSAPLHDVGKIMVSDTILNKPGRLTEEEFASMKGHTTSGRVIIERAVDAVSEPSYLDEAKNLAEFHHERWDGRGYPSGRSGTEIPLSARIMAVADVFDALVSKRSYKEGFPIEKALEIIRDGAGSQFDPYVAQAFLNAEDEVRRVAEEHGDSEGKQTFDVHDIDPSEAK